MILENMQHLKTSRRARKRRTPWPVGRRKARRLLGFSWSQKPRGECSGWMEGAMLLNVRQVACSSSLWGLGCKHSYCVCQEQILSLTRADRKKRYFKDMQILLINEDSI